MTGNVIPNGFPVARFIEEGPGRSLTTADHVGTDHELPAGIKRFTGNHHAIHQPGLSAPVWTPATLGITREGMADEDCVCSSPGSGHIGLISKGERWEGLPTFGDEGEWIFKVCGGDSTDRFPDPWGCAWSAWSRSSMRSSISSVPTREPDIIRRHPVALCSYGESCWCVRS